MTSGDPSITLEVGENLAGMLLAMLGWLFAAYVVLVIVLVAVVSKVEGWIAAWRKERGDA